MESKLKSIKHTRAYIRQQVTVVSNDVAANGRIFDRTKKLQVVKKLKSYQLSLKESDDKVIELLWDEAKSDEVNETVQTQELDIITQYEEKITESLALLETEAGEAESPSFSTCRLRPQSASLPKYGGTLNESYEKFILTFEAILSGQPYSDIEKFLLLMQSCTDNALSILNSLDITEQTYEAAKRLLEQALASPTNQKFHVLQRLVDLKLSYKKNPYEFAAELRTIKQLFTNLNVDVDFVLQFFYWRAFNDTMREQLVQITNSNKPNLAEIEQNLFVAIERYQSALKRTDTRLPEATRKCTTMATNVEYSKRIESGPGRKCSLCEGDHSYFQCKVYPSASQKLQRIKERGGCEKCSLTNHKTYKRARGMREVFLN